MRPLVVELKSSYCIRLGDSERSHVLVVAQLLSNLAFFIPELDDDDLCLRFFEFIGRSNGGEWWWGDREDDEHLDCFSFWWFKFKAIFNWFSGLWMLFGSYLLLVGLDVNVLHFICFFPLWSSSTWTQKRLEN
jgi:hypothetical protein